MLKPIEGSWLEFQHHSRVEGRYWNPICRHFDKEQWEEKIAEMASLHMKYIVLLCSSLVEDPDESGFAGIRESYFETDIYPSADLPCEDPMGALLTAADRHGMKVFVSCGFYGNWRNSHANRDDSGVRDRAFRAMEQMVGLYGSHPSFYGWYLPDEACINGCFDEAFIRYINEYAARGRSLLPESKVLIAPYGTRLLRADDAYAAQLERIDADMIAYQDEVGVKKSVPEETAAFYEGLRRVHDLAGRSALWADIELFRFEGEVYRSALLPADMDRIRRQMESVSPYVDKVLCYQYMGLMNRPGTRAFCGHPDSVELYEDYRKLFGFPAHS